MFRHRSATPAGVTGNGEVRSLGDNVTSIKGSAVGARADTATASITAVAQPVGVRSVLPGVKVACRSELSLFSGRTGCSGSPDREARR
jgi:hypothetical protein